MEETPRTAARASRVARHRRKTTGGGSQRVEVTVPARDASLVKAVAGALRLGGDDADRIRESLRPLMSASQASTGKELVAFLRSSPFVEIELPIERDRSTGRDIDLGR